MRKKLDGRLSQLRDRLPSNIFSKVYKWDFDYANRHESGTLEDFISPKGLIIHIEFLLEFVGGIH